MPAFTEESMSVPPATEPGREVAAATRRLLAYCQTNNWAGYEPYDALNSKIFEALPVLNFRVARLALTQALKRAPVNLRPLMLIGKTQNPKALAVFLSAFVRLSKLGIGCQEDYVRLVVERLIALRSQGFPYWCWGYSFPWQTRTVLVPRWSPNLVCTSFAGDALLEVYEHNRDARCLEMAVSAAEYLLHELYWTGAGPVAGFGYPLPAVRNQVHNANFLASDLLCRVYRHTGEEKFLDPALRAARYSAAQQRSDGSWYYGEAGSQQWIDNFHTGFNLSALRSIGHYAGTTEFEPAVRKGLEFYRARFFREDGAVRYYHDRTYPIDTHCVAQSIITLLDLKDLDPDNVALARKVFAWTMQHMWSERGFFYYRVLRTCTIRTSYIRWTQAWMLLALAMLWAESGEAPPAMEPVSAMERGGAAV
jgi:hypothetical protein